MRIWPPIALHIGNAHERDQRHRLFDPVDIARQGRVERCARHRDHGQDHQREHRNAAEQRQQPLRLRQQTPDPAWLSRLPSSRTVRLSCHALPPSFPLSKPGWAGRPARARHPAYVDQLPPHCRSGSSAQDHTAPAPAGPGRSCPHPFFADRIGGLLAEFGQLASSEIITFSRPFRPARCPIWSAARRSSPGNGQSPHRSSCPAPRGGSLSAS